MPKKKHQHAFPNVNRADLKAAVDSGELPAMPDSGKRYDASSDPAMRLRMNPDTCGHKDPVYVLHRIGFALCEDCFEKAAEALKKLSDELEQEIQDQRSHAAGRL